MTEGVSSQTSGELLVTAGVSGQASEAKLQGEYHLGEGAAGAGAGSGAGAGVGTGAGAKISAG